jgi:hypothetical protein
MTKTLLPQQDNDERIHSSGQRSNLFANFLRSINSRMHNSFSSHSLSSWCTDSSSSTTHDTLSLENCCRSSATTIGRQDIVDPATDYGYGFCVPDHDEQFIKDHTLKCNGVKWKRNRDNAKYAQLDLIPQDMVVLIRRAPRRRSSLQQRRLSIGESGTRRLLGNGSVSSLPSWQDDRAADLQRLQDGEDAIRTWIIAVAQTILQWFDELGDDVPCSRIEVIL